MVTVAHVLDGGPAVRVDGTPRRACVRIDRRDDLAVLAVSGPAAPRSIRTGAGGDRRRSRCSHARPACGARCTAVVRGLAPARRPALDLDAAVAPGDSGAPVIGRDGRVVGILFAASRERARTAYAVDGTAVGALLRQTAPR